jgi:ferredoxin-NADP reductase
MDHTTAILEKTYLTHDVIQFRLKKPAGFIYTAGQAVEISLPENSHSHKAPFTMTSLNDKPYLEFIIKIYEQHQGLTLSLSHKKQGDFLTLTDPWDSFQVKGPGIFIAGGTGITPFIAILRALKENGNISGSKLFFSNKTGADIFLENELRDLLGKGYMNVITREKSHKDFSARMNAVLFQKYISDFSQPFYICGPENFVSDIQAHLSELGVSKEMADLAL